MATKQQVITAINKLNGTLIDNCSRFYYDVELEAPQGFSWGDCHSRVISWFDCANKPEFWSEVLAEMKYLEPIKCNAKNCEYWSEEE